MATQVTVGQKVAEIARILGENPSDIRTDNPRWVDMLQEGVIVKITLRRWRGRTRLDLDGDLGIPINGEGELYRDLLDIGNKLLLPRRIQKELDSIDSAARQNLERFGYKTHWGMFIPATAYQAWKAKNGEYQDKYFAARDEIVKFYDDIIARQLDEYAEAARVAYKRRNRLQPGQDFDYRFLPVDQFVEGYMERLKLLIPSKEQIAASFAYEVELHYIPLPSLLAADVEQAAGVKRQIEVRALKVQGEARRQAALDAMNQEVLEQAQVQKERLIDGFLSDVVRQLRSLVYDSVVAVGEATAKNGYVHPRSVGQLQGLVAQVERLNFIGDKDTDAMVERLRSLTAKAAPDRDPVELQTALRDVAIVTRASLLALGDQPRSSRALALPDNVPAEELKRARRALALPEAPAPRGNDNVRQQQVFAEVEIGVMVDDAGRRGRRKL